MNWKRGLGIGFIFTGIFISLTARVITGRVVGFARENYLGIFGILVLIVGLILIFMAREKSKLSHLEKILSKEYEGTIPVYESVQKGIMNTEEMYPFIAKTKEGLSYFIHVKSKKDAADIANYLVRGRRLYADLSTEKTFGKKARSLDIKKLEKIKDYLKKFRPKRIGFARGEYETKEGRGWEREALYHQPHKDLGINYPHYGVTYGKGAKKREIHILIKKD